MLFNFLKVIEKLIKFNKEEIIFKKIILIENHCEMEGICFFL